MPYEDRHVRIPDAEPGEVLRFLMEQHGLKQGDLDDCAPQSRICDFLNGKREISKGDREEVCSTVRGASRPVPVIPRRVSAPAAVPLSSSA
jgi:hypothetical protein